MASDQLARILRWLKGMPEMPRCTYCGGTDFYEGPSGGGSINILCANEKCRHWFNHTPFGLDDLKRVEPTDEEKKEAAKESEKRQNEILNSAYEEGRQLYRKGYASLACLHNSFKEGNNYYQKMDIIRLAGWLDEREGGQI